MNSNVTDKGTTTQRDSLSELLGQLANNSADVVHDEIELVIQGIREKAAAARSGVVTVVTGAVVGFAAFLSLCTALIIGLSSYMAPRHGGACHWIGACFNRCRHCLRRLQAIEKVHP